MPKITREKEIYDCLVAEIAMHNAIARYVKDTTGIDLDGVDLDECLDIEQAKKDAEEIYEILVMD